MSSYMNSLTFFFFQAEDGIRDFHVTGVQTCALPIWPTPHRWSTRPMWRWPREAADWRCSITTPRTTTRLWLVWKRSRRSAPPRAARSEERRVGKEGRSRRLLEQQKKNHVREITKCVL